MKILFLLPDEVTTLKERYIVLQLDTFAVKGRQETTTAYSILETVSLADAANLTEFLALHSKLLENFGKKNWAFCKESIHYLTGKWNGEIDTFYESLLNRINYYIDNDPGEDWRGQFIALPSSPAPVATEYIEISEKTD